MSRWNAGPGEAEGVPSGIESVSSFYSVSITGMPIRQVLGCIQHACTGRHQPEGRGREKAKGGDDFGGAASLCEHRNHQHGKARNGEQFDPQTRKLLHRGVEHADPCALRVMDTGSCATNSFSLPSSFTSLAPPRPCCRCWIRSPS